jgi:hypothetical protein
MSDNAWPGSEDKPLKQPSKKRVLSGRPQHVPGLGTEIVLSAELIDNIAYECRLSRSRVTTVLNKYSPFPFFDMSKIELA